MGVLCQQPWSELGSHAVLLPRENLVLKAGVRGTSWTSLSWNRGPFLAPRGPPGYAFFMKRPFTAKAVLHSAGKQAQHQHHLL